MFTFIETDSAAGEQDGEASRKAEEKFRTLFNSVTDCMLILDLDGYIRNINVAGHERLGYTREEMLGMHITQLEPPEASAEADKIIATLKEHGSAIFESAHVHKDGSVMPVEINCRRIELDGQYVYFSVIRDISDRKHAQRALKMMQFSIDQMGDAATWVTRDARVVYANLAACHSLGYSIEEMLGLGVQDYYPDMTESAWPAHWNEVKEQGSVTFETSYCTQSGENIPVEVTENYMQYEDEEYCCAFIRDISKRKLAEEKIAHLAHYDLITDLPNRTLFYDRLEHAIAQARRYKQRVAVLFLDLDGFKKVNDNFGHQVGDGLLKGVATRLNENTRGMDTVARVGGDEFIFILNDIEHADNAAVVAKKVVDALAQPFIIKKNICMIGGSIGISIFPEDSVKAETLVKQADEAMYLAKNNGKNNYQFYSVSKRQKAQGISG